MEFSDMRIAEAVSIKSTTLEVNLFYRTRRLHKSNLKWLTQTLLYRNWLPDKQVGSGVIELLTYSNLINDKRNLYIRPLGLYLKYNLPQFTVCESQKFMR